MTSSIAVISHENMFILNMIITSCYDPNILNLQKLLLRHNIWDIYTFEIIKYILGPKNVI